MLAIPVKLNGEQTTMADAYAKIRDSKLRKVPNGLHLGPQGFETDNGTFVLDCDPSLLSTVCSLFILEQEQKNPYQVSWYYYDHDHSDMASAVQTFFVVHEGKIIRESHHFNWDEPMILKRHSEEDPIWHNEPYFDEALDHYRYQQFYTETLTGKLMVLRPDEPILYFFERPRAGEGQKTFEVLALVTLGKIYRAIWVALALLAASAYPPLREIMVTVAIMLFFNLLLFSWMNRHMAEA
jgi:hypothetical protein